MKQTNGNASRRASWISGRASEDGRGRTEGRGQNSREEARRQRLEVSFCRRMGLIGRGGLPIVVDCGVGANRVQNHAKTNRISPLTAELGNVCQTWWLSESVASLVATDLLGVTRSQGTSSQTLIEPAQPASLPARPARGPVPCMSRPTTQSSASNFKWGASFALDVSLAEI